MVPFSAATKLLKNKQEKGATSLWHKIRSMKTEKPMPAEAAADITGISALLPALKTVEWHPLGRPGRLVKERLFSVIVEDPTDRSKHQQITLHVDRQAIGAKPTLEVEILSRRASGVESRLRLSSLSEALEYVADHLRRQGV